MNVYTSDGLLVEQTASPDATPLAVEQGRQLISIYRLFLQLHHASSGAMGIKDMLKPDAGDTTGNTNNSNNNINSMNSNTAPDKATDRRAGNNRIGGVNNSNALNGGGNWGSMPAMPEAVSAYSSSIAAISAGTPYPIFLLSSNAIPETHRLRGFPSGRPVVLPGVTTKNNNRSCNGCEEIPLRWSLLSKQSPTPIGGVPESAEGNTQRGGMGGGGGAHSNGGQTAELSDTASLNAGSGGAAMHGSGADTAQGLAGRSGLEAATRPSANAVVAAHGATATEHSTNMSTAVTTAAAVSALPPVSRVFASGWCAAELQVHTTHRVLICTATELALDAGDVVEDGNAPLVFCCAVQSHTL